MSAKRLEKSTEPFEQGKIRVSVGFSPDIHATLEKIARGKKVSLGWVVREAVDHYLAEQAPLFARTRSDR